MVVEKLVVGSLQTNCYLCWDEETTNLVIIDPGDDGDFIIQKILSLDLKPQLIIATHGHFDHVLAVTELRLAFKIPFLLHKKDLFLYQRASKTNTFFTKTKSDPVLPVDRFIKEGDKLSVGRLALDVRETPGHTPGSISLLSKGIVFSGDTIFSQGIGRTDYSYSSKTDLDLSIKKLLRLSPETIIYPGHGKETTIEEEKVFFLTEMVE